MHSPIHNPHALTVHSPTAAGTWDLQPPVAFTRTFTAAAAPAAAAAIPAGTRCQARAAGWCHCRAIRWFTPAAAVNTAGGLASSAAG